MITLYVTNVNEALSRGIQLIYNKPTVLEDSRNGPVRRVLQPVTTVYSQPNERVLTHPVRDANPFFHAVEMVWMIAGRNTLADLTPYVSRMADFSDDGGITQPAAYGHRWRKHFGYLTPGSTGLVVKVLDQLNWVVKRLRDNLNDRRVVIQMWDPETDIPAADAGGRDVPCNLTALPWVSDNQLHLTVFCRSNDMVWGAYGANAVHFSFLLEYLAARLDLAVGTLTQVSNNFHAYLDTVPPWIDAWPKKIWDAGDEYKQGIIKPFPIFSQWDAFISGTDERREKIIQEDLAVFFEHGAFESSTKARWPFLKRVIVPLALAHRHWRTKKGAERYEGARDILDRCEASDWRFAANQWLTRRELRAVRAKDDGVNHDV